MSPDHWDRIEQLFAEALERSPQEREAYILAAASDPELRRDVLLLLQAHEAAGRLDSIAEQLRGLGPAASASQATRVMNRLKAGVAERYCIERELGRGGMAYVFLAEDLKHHRKVALKVLRPTLALNLGPARFLREIAIAAQLSHPHILPLHDSGSVDGLLYYVMPYVEGESLRERLERERRLPSRDALAIAGQVADALAYAHGRGVVHRDIKPENILLQAGHALVADFGIARAMSAAGGEGLTDAGVLLGTPSYMSPEQAAGKEDIDGRSDIYSLGCVLYEMLAGEPPFAGLDPQRVLEQQLTGRPRALKGAGPRAAAGVVRRALAKAPADRFASAEAFAAALRDPPATVASPHRWQVATFAGLALGGVGIVAAARLVHPGSAAHPPWSVIAVLPLSPAEADTALTRLGRDLVVTLSANLDGVGEIRTVDAQTMLAQTSWSKPLPLERGAQLARRLGASSVLHGTIVDVGSKVRADVGLFAADSGQVLARASATTDPGDLATLTDSLTWGLLRDVWRTHTPPTPNLAGLTTGSVPALRAFLEGERAGLEGRWNDAADAYARAMRADPAFWLAYWRYGSARWWYLDAVEDSVLTPLYAHRFSLPERDRLVLESWWTDTVTVALARGREVTERYPDYWPGWMQYADWLFHVGPVHGYTLEEAQAALERTVALNPAFVPAWEHLFWATIARDTVSASRALDALARLDFRGSSIEEFGYDVTRVYRLELELARAGRLNPPLLDSVASDLMRTARGRAGAGATLLPVQVELSRRVLSEHPRPDLAAVHERLLADAWAGRGAWDSALAVAERHARRPVGADVLDAYRLAVIGSWLGAVAPDHALHLRSGPARALARPGLSTKSQAELAWLDGILAVRRGNREEVRAARTAVQRSNAATSGVLDRSLEAFDEELAGARHRAARALAELNWSRPDLLVPGYEEHPYVIAISRLAAARWLLAEGDTAQAERVLMWFDAWWALDGYRPARRVLAGLAALEHARIAAARGDWEAARRRYGEFLRRYDQPVAAHRQLVEQARIVLASLRE